MSMEKNLNNFIDELIQEIEKELDEATTTANVAGYNVPGAFSDGGRKDKKRKKKIATQFGYKIVGKMDEDSINEAKDEVTPKQLSKIQNDIKKINRKIKVYISKHPVTKGKLQIELGGDHPAGDGDDREIQKIDKVLKKHTGTVHTGTIFMESVNENKYRMMKRSSATKMLNKKLTIKQIGSRERFKDTKSGKPVKLNGFAFHIPGKGYIGMKDGKGMPYIPLGGKKALQQILDDGGFLDYKKNTLINPVDESVNEAKVKRPVNRWLELKNDETMHPHKKMAMGLKELKYQLRETEKFFNWYNKIKTMNELDSNQYWKRTNTHIYTIKEKLINIAKTIQEIEK